MDLKVVGAGHLGLRIAFLWKQKFPEAKIFLKTRSYDENRSAKWKSLGFHPLSAETENDSNRIKTPFVVFSAPPTNNPTYADDVEDSTKNDWMAGNNGVFVFTASGGVYSENSGKVVDETSEVTRSTDRSKALLSAEDLVLKAGGVVIRFGGLYTKTRGPHNFWLATGEKREFSSIPNGLINLIHYDDAASCILATLLKPLSDAKRLFLVSDGVPISRQAICEGALKCPAYLDKNLPKFTGDPNTINGKKYDTSLICKTFEWTPKFKSFAEFMANGFDDELNMDDF